ncbi:MAG: hypothetical protein HYU52_17745 [Acidobacteria bacterium]|nr:hypothetical protein [Acidobacteriota bacterium]
MSIVTITFNSSSTPQIQCNPDPVHVPYGNSQSVTWNLQTPGATFAANGIYFKGTSPGTLTRVTDTQYSLADDNTNTSGQDVGYSYGINITYNGQPYNLDPEVDNDPEHGPMNLRYKSS